MRPPFATVAFALLALAVLAAPASAQVAPAPVLAIEQIKTPAPVTEDAPANLTAVWRYSLQNPAQLAGAYATGKTVIQWTAGCDDPGIRLTGPAETEVEFALVETVYSGPVAWTVETASSMEKVVKCRLTAKAQAAGPTVPESNEAVSEFTVVVGSPPAAVAKAAGPEPAQDPAALHAEEAPGVTFLGGLAGVGAALALGRRGQQR